MLLKLREEYFDGKFTGVMKVCDGRNNICIGFYNNIKFAKELETKLLQKIPRKVYDDIIDRVGLKTKEKDGKGKKNR